MTIAQELTLPALTGDRLAGLPVVILGAGPVGLAAAANLAQRGIDFIVLEAGEAVAASMRLWGHTRMFSPWRLLIDPASRRLLRAAGWTQPNPDATPSGHELVEDYLVPLSELEQIASRIRFGARVIAVSRQGMDRTRTAGRAEAPFVVRLKGCDGVISELAGRAVIDASGTYTTPNPLASSGLTPLGAAAAGDRIVHALPDVLGSDRVRFAGRHTTVVGAGHSAANALIALTELARSHPETRVAWLIRNTSAVRVSSWPEDELPDRARLGSRVNQLVSDGCIQLIDGFEVRAVDADGAGLRLRGTRRGKPDYHDTDVVIGATGFRPDLDMLREVRLRLDEIIEAPLRLAPLIDPNIHSCGTVEPHGFRELAHPEPGFFLVGMKSYGRAPTFLLATGYEQVRSVVAWLDGDLPSAVEVQLTLPATGVCSTEDSCCS